MVEQRGTWQIYGERTVYDTSWVRLGLADVEAPNGQRWEYHVVHLPRIAIALVVNDRDEALMLWRYRFPTEQWGYELLGGLVEDGEDAAATAAREAAEESGWQPTGAAEHLVSFQPLPGQVTAPVEVYTSGAARGTSVSQPRPKKSAASDGFRSPASRNSLSGKDFSGRERLSHCCTTWQHAETPGSEAPRSTPVGHRNHERLVGYVQPDGLQQKKWAAYRPGWIRVAGGPWRTRQDALVWLVDPHVPRNRKY
jgi:hypothetical protein